MKRIFHPHKRYFPLQGRPWRFTTDKNANATAFVQGTSDADLTAKASVRDTVDTTSTATASVQVQDNDVTANAKTTILDTVDVSANAEVAVLGGDVAMSAIASVLGQAPDVTANAKASVQVQDNDKTANALTDVVGSTDKTMTAEVVVDGAEIRMSAACSVKETVDVAGSFPTTSCLQPDGTSTNSLRYTGAATIDIAIAKGVDPPTVPSHLSYAFLNGGDSLASARVSLTNHSFGAFTSVDSVVVNGYLGNSAVDSTVQYLIYVMGVLAASGSVVTGPSGWVSFNWIPPGGTSQVDLDSMEIEVQLNPGASGSDVPQVWLDALEVCVTVTRPGGGGGTGGGGSAGDASTCLAKATVQRSPFWMEPDGMGIHASSIPFSGAASAWQSIHRQGLRYPTAPDHSSYVYAQDGANETSYFALGHNVDLFTGEQVGSITVYAYLGTDTNAFKQVFIGLGVDNAGGLSPEWVFNGYNPTLATAGWFQFTYDPVTAGNAPISQAQLDAFAIHIQIIAPTVGSAWVDCVYVQINSGGVYRTLSAMVTVGETMDISMAALVEVTRLATTKHRAISPQFCRMVEVDWPLLTPQPDGSHGTHRYADRDLAVEAVGFSGRVLDLGPVNWSMNGQKDSVTFSISNLPTLVAVEDLWSDANPPEGAEVRIYYLFVGDRLADRVEIFKGVIEQIRKYNDESIEVSAFSVEEKYDQLLGQEINTTDYPDAPVESVGKMQPIIFGTVPGVQGIPVTEIGRSQLASVSLKDDTTISLGDVSRFPNSGHFLIGEEVIAYSARNTSLNILTCSPRTLDYPEGTEVAEQGELQILVAGHATTIGDVFAMKGDRFTKVDSSLYTIPTGGLNLGNTIKFANGWPTVRTPAGGTQFAQVQFDTANAGSTAIDPTNACAGAAGWSEKNPAILDTDVHKYLEVSEGVAPEAQGQIIRTWVAVEFDDSGYDSLSDLIDGLDTVSVWVKKADPHSVYTFESLGNLTQGGNLPAAVLQRLGGLGTTRAYDDTHGIQDPGHSHAQTAATSSVDLTAGTDPAAPYASGVHSPGLDTGMCYRRGVNSVGVTGSIVSVTAEIIVNNTSGRNLACAVACRGTLQSATFTGTGFNTRGLAATVYPGAHTISITLMVSFSGPSFTSWSDFTDAGSFLEFFDPAALISLGTLGGMVTSMKFTVVYNAATTAIQNSATGVSQVDASGNPTSSPLLHTVACLFDVTGLDTGYFLEWANLQDSSVLVQYNYASDPSTVNQKVPIKRVSYLVEYAAYRNEPADRILANVAGLVPAGNPADIVSEVITNAGLLDLDASVLLSGDFTLAQDAYDDISYRLDFVLRDKIQAAELLQRIAAQSRMLYWWEFGRLAVAFDPDLADLPAAQLTLQESADFDISNVEIERTILRDLIHDLTYHWGQNDREGRLAKVDNTAVATTVGVTVKQGIDFDLIQDDVTAANLAGYTVEHKSKPRGLATVPIFLLGLEVRRADMVAIVSRRRRFASIQMKQITVHEEGVSLQGTIWDTI